MPLLFKIRKLTIRQVTLVLTFIVLMTNICAGLLVHYGNNISWNILGGLILLLINFLTIRYFVERFLFYKIKLIYKLITDSKKEINPKDIDDNIENVNQRVIEWAENTKNEIASLKSLEEYRKNYVGNISHELKTPIFTIQGYLHTLIDGGLYDSKINVDFLKKAADNTDRLQNIVEDLEVISKLESGQADLEMIPFDIKDLCEDVADDLTSMAEKKKISIKFKEKSTPITLVNADKNAIRQVISNLLVNSIKYGRDGGVTKIGFHDLETEILCEISDNGIGIDEKHIKHLFDRFYRVDSSRSRKQGGSGLGLSIVKHIIEAHNQTIHVRSTPELGSTFSFTLKK
jgi:two-component system, OmpR family, phosphate regulon sensor histidine kinase PhoR